MKFSTIFKPRTANTYPIGIDMGEDAVKLVQLIGHGDGFGVMAGGSKECPADIKGGSGPWQRWAISAVRAMIGDGQFNGKEIVAALPVEDVFIDLIKKPKNSEGHLGEAVVARIKGHLGFDAADAVIKYVPTEEDNLLVLAMSREKIDRHLAIYERANLHLKSIVVWPMALANNYVNFFGRRKVDLEVVVMLLDIQAKCTNVVICKHKNLLLARSVPIGAEQLGDESAVNRLVLELTVCRRQFSGVYKQSLIEHLIFLSGSGCSGVDTAVCATIAKQLEIPAQMGDCLAAVNVPAGEGGPVIDRRECRFSWATAFGLSLS